MSSLQTGVFAGPVGSTVGQHRFNPDAVVREYAAEWTPGGVDFFIDGDLIRTVGQSPAYPMQLMLGIYEFPPEDGHERTSAYPKAFVVDDVRGYRLAV